MNEAAINPFGSTAVAERQSQARPSLVAKFANKFAIEPNKLLAVLKATAFKQGKDDPEVTNEQMAALLVVADQYGLNPFTKEIYAFADKFKGVVPIVGIDGWSRIINDRPELDGIEFNYPPDGGNAWTECVIHRKDRARPTVVREYLSECKRGTGPWGSHPSRMLRHKALIQCARVAFGFAGIYDQDEAERIVERDVTPAFHEDEPPQLTGAAALKEAAKRSRAPARAAEVDRETGEIADQPKTAAQQATTTKETSPAENPAAAAVPPDADLSALLDAISKLDEFTDVELMALYAEGLPEAIRNDDRFAARFGARMGEIKAAAKRK